MAAQKDGEKIYEVIQGGPIEHGEAVRFDLRLGDGATKAFHASWPDYQKITSQFFMLGAETEKFRATRGAPPTQDDLVRPFQATKCRTAIFPDDHVLLQVSIENGPPLAMRMTADLAKQLIEKIQTSLAQVARGWDSKPH